MSQRRHEMPHWECRRRTPERSVRSRVRSGHVPIDARLEERRDAKHRTHLIPTISSRGLPRRAPPMRLARSRPCGLRPHRARISVRARVGQPLCIIWAHRWLGCAGSEQFERICPGGRARARPWGSSPLARNLIWTGGGEHRGRAKRKGKQAERRGRAKRQDGKNRGGGRFGARADSVRARGRVWELPSHAETEAGDAAERKPES